MSGLEHKARGRGAPKADIPDPSARVPGGEFDVRPSPGNRNRERTQRHSVPRWRQIEIMRERQQLKKLLDDFGDDDVQFDEEIFNFGQESDGYYDSAGEPDLEDAGLDGELDEEAFYEE